jgi:PilZ domain
MTLAAVPPLIRPPISIERRSGARFPLDLKIRYRTLGRARPLAGTGWVVNMSSGGVLVVCQHEINTGTRLELNIEWPSLLDGQIPLQLVTLGRVLRSETSSFAAVLASYQFRTTRRSTNRTVVPIDEPLGGALRLMKRPVRA